MMVNIKRETFYIFFDALKEGMLGYVLDPYDHDKRDRWHRVFKEMSDYVTDIETENARLREENATMKSGIKWVNPREARRWSNGILRIKEPIRNEKGEEISCDEDDFIPYTIGCFVDSDNDTGTPRLFLCDDGREFHETDPIIHKYAEFPEPRLKQRTLNCTLKTNV